MPLFSLSIGVYQGDTLSGISFNTEITTLIIATQELRKDPGYSTSPSHPVNLLQYAEDTCIIVA